MSMRPSAECANRSVCGRRGRDERETHLEKRNPVESEPFVCRGGYYLEERSGVNEDPGASVGERGNPKHCFAMSDVYGLCY